MRWGEAKKIDCRADDSIEGEADEKPIGPPSGLYQSIADNKMNNWEEKENITTDNPCQSRSKKGKSVIGIGKDDVGVHKAGDDHHNADSDDVVRHPF